MAVFLLFSGWLVSVTALSDTRLECTNDYDESMFCRFDAENCTKYNVTVRNNAGYGENHCLPTRCSTGSCCCSLHTKLVYGEDHTASVLEDGNLLDSKSISVSASIKPKRPQILSVKESNGNFGVRWLTNYGTDSFSRNLRAVLTLQEKGDPQQKTRYEVNPATVDGVEYYEIPGEDLKPRTPYVVSVESIWNDVLSDSSEEHEFTTPASHNTLLWGVITGLSFLSVIISGTMYGCYLRLKTKWWDSFGENPKLLDINPSKHERMFTPVPPVISSISVEPLIPQDGQLWSKGSLSDVSKESLLHSSGISTGSSSLSYAKTNAADMIAGMHEALSKAFMALNPLSPPSSNIPPDCGRATEVSAARDDPCRITADDLGSAISNKTYSIVIPSSPPQEHWDSVRIEKLTGRACESAHPLSERNTSTCPDKPEAAATTHWAPAIEQIHFPAAGVPGIQVNMSYQRCDVGSEADDLCVPSDAGATDTAQPFPLRSTAEVWCMSHEVPGDGTEPESKDVSVCEAAHSFPLVDDSYQAFQTLVEQPAV